MALFISPAHYLGIKLQSNRFFIVMLNLLKPAIVNICSPVIVNDSVHHQLNLLYQVPLLVIVLHNILHTVF